MPLLCLQKLQGKGDGELKKWCYIFRLTRRYRVRGKIKKLPSYSTSNKLLLVARRIFKNAFKVGTVNHKFILTTFHCEETAPEVRDLSDARQKSRELITLPELPYRHVYMDSSAVGLRIINYPHGRGGLRIMNYPHGRGHL